jgi:ankyrin repeat protein
MASRATRRESQVDLYHAIQNGRVGEVSRLLKKGVDPNASGDDTSHPKLAKTPLCSAVSQAASALRVLGTVTQKAIGKRQRSLQIIGLLLEAGADPNLRMLARTPLSVAVHQADYEVALLLLDAGASPSGECWSFLPEKRYGKWAVAPCSNAIHEAAEKGYTEIVKMLCKHGADVSVRDHSGRTPLQMARDPETVRILKRYEKKAVRKYMG